LNERFQIHQSADLYVIGQAGFDPLLIRHSFVFKIEQQNLAGAQNDLLKAFGIHPLSLPGG
jgi:hypothetical protein